MNRFGGLRRHEVVVIVYFCLAALVAVWRGLPFRPLALTMALPAVLACLAYLETVHGNAATGVIREWSSLVLILAAYWQLQWFVGGYWPGWEQRFESWDAALLGAIPALPSTLQVFGAGLLQASYSLLYALPPIYLGIIYATRRANADKFLFTLFLGTFTAYLLLPHFPVRAPRFAFTPQMAPSVITIFGKWNLWVLDRFDISTSVFPSGHVAVAFSSAFGLLRALPGRPRVWASAFALAVCVWAATVYCRYHYAADGAASFLISIAAWRLSGRWDMCADG